MDEKMIRRTEWKENYREEKDIYFDRIYWIFKFLGKLYYFILGRIENEWFWWKYRIWTYDRNYENKLEMRNFIEILWGNEY